MNGAPRRLPFLQNIGVDGVRLIAKKLLFPGLDVNTRCRYRMLQKAFTSGPVRTLDAGCGNGALGYAAYRLGNSVLGISNDREQIQRCKEYYGWLNCDPDRLQFQQLELRAVASLGPVFDQIICSETLEHIKDDERVVHDFHKVLRPGGVLHLCCPNALHPHHRLGRTNAPEDGGHVRDGYTLQSYNQLLSSCGFRVVDSWGIGGHLLVSIDRIVRVARNAAGDAVGLPIFLATWPLQLLDKRNPELPYSLYVKAVRIGENSR